MEIQVGEYVRLDRCQGINKIIEIEDDGECYVLDEYIANEWGDSTCYLYENEIKDEVLKHSFNIIDLIEVGDYVNGYRVDDIEKGKLIVGNTTLVIEQIIENQDIESIVTHEQYKNIEYKLGE